MRPDRAAALRVVAIDAADELARLRPAWDALWSRSSRATPFQSPEWLLPWWRHLGGSELRGLAVWQQARLVGLAPFYVWTDPTSGQRQVTLLGNGVTDHLDLLAANGMAQRVSTAVLARLGEGCDDWHGCDFRDLPADSALLDAPCPGDIDEERVADEPCPTLALSPSPDALDRQTLAGLRKRLGYARRRAERTGAVRVEIADAAGLGCAFERLVALHRARWRGRDESGVLDDSRVLAFHRAVMRGFLARGWLRLYTLYVGERPAAVHYGFAAKGRAYYYLGGFAPELGDVSPGQLLLHHAVGEALREGAREFDFLRGRERYKYEWGAEDRPKFRRRLRRA